MQGMCSDEPQAHPSANEDCNNRDRVSLYKLRFHCVEQSFKFLCALDAGFAELGMRERIR